MANSKKYMIKNSNECLNKILEKINIIPYSLYQIKNHPDCMYAEATYNDIKVFTIIRISGYPTFDAINKIIGNRFKKYVECASISGWCSSIKITPQISSVEFKYNDKNIKLLDMNEEFFIKLYKASYGKIKGSMNFCWRPLLANEELYPIGDSNINNYKNILSIIREIIDKSPNIKNAIQDIINTSEGK